MAKEIETTKKELKEQNTFLRNMLKSFEDIRKGRISDYKFITK